MEANAENGTVVFPFRLTINLRRFDNDLEFINVALIQNNFAERIFSFSNYHQQRHLPISKHGGIDAVKASNVFPEITLIENRIVVYEDYVIYTFEDDLLFDMELPPTVDLDLNVDILGNNSGNTEERTPFAVATVVLIQDSLPGCT